MKHYTKTGVLLPTAQTALEHVAQINIRYHITDIHHTRTATFNGQLHYMDEKTMAQILHYMNGGKMFDTLRHAVVTNVVHFEESTNTINRQVEEQMHRLQVVIPIDQQANIQNR